MALQVAGPPCIDVPSSQWTAHPRRAWLCPCPGLQLTFIIQGFRTIIQDDCKTIAK